MPLHTILPSRTTKRKKSHMSDIRYCQRESKSGWRKTSTNQTSQKHQPLRVSFSLSFCQAHAYCNTSMVESKTESRFKYIKWVWYNEKQIKLTLLKWEVNTFHLYLPLTIALHGTKLRKKSSSFHLLEGAVERTGIHPNNW